MWPVHAIHVPHQGIEAGTIAGFSSNGRVHEESDDSALAVIADDAVHRVRVGLVVFDPGVERSQFSGTDLTAGRGLERVV